MVVLGAVIFFVQIIIWNQLNDRLPAKQQIPWQQALMTTFPWFEKGGLLEQHARLYPESSWRMVFKVMWGLFWFIVAARIASK